MSSTNPISGTTGTLFTNTATGGLTAQGQNQGNLDMPYVNSGTFAAGARSCTSGALACFVRATL
jgi:hypothetical protein